MRKYSCPKIVILILLTGLSSISFSSGGFAADSALSTVEDKTSAHIRVGLVRDKALDQYCGVSLQFSRDYKAERNFKYAFKMGSVRERLDMNQSVWREYAVMHLDGRDRFFKLLSSVSTTQADATQKIETLTLQSPEYRLNIKWLYFDICNLGHNEDCEVEGLRSYITIQRGDALRHIRLLGISGC